MREILFRGKRVDNEQWIEGSLVNNIFFRAGTNCSVPYIINPDEYEEYCCMEDIGELAVEVLKETVGQFTGITDKNGKKIFEGDVVRIEDFANAVVKWREDIACWTLQGYIIGNTWDSSMLEVIGNIHDNSELLT